MKTKYQYKELCKSCIHRDRNPRSHLKCELAHIKNLAWSVTVLKQQDNMYIARCPKYVKETV